jgi:hypothetical protein
MNEFYIKISKCIDSSLTKEHFNSCERMIEFFEFKYCAKPIDKIYSRKLLRNLIHKLCVAKDLCNIYN